MSLVKGNIKKDFFEQNSALMIKSEMKELIRQTTKKIASQIMWSIYLIEDLESPLYRMPREDRIKEVQSEYFEIDVEKYKWLMDAYARLSMSKEEAMYKVHMDTLDRVTSHLKTLSLDDKDEFNKIIKILEKLPKMWTGLEIVKNKMIDVESKANIKGGAKESFSEKRGRD